MPEKRSLCTRAALACLVLFSLSFAAAAQEQPAATQTQTPTPTPESPGDETTATKSFERLEWRSIGPANMGGRIADIEGVAGNPNLVYVATASGGLFKTTNGGAKWTPVFERQGSISIGDIALEPGNPDVIWLGAGESAVRNSVSFGDGVYKSTDGGQTWRHMGLGDTEHVSKILINPRNPDIVYVGAVGHAFGPNDERGVFMTTDGGQTWKKTLYIDADHGVADMDIDPSNPNILYAVMWKFRRTPWTHTVKLLVGDKSFEKKVEVRLDPTISVPASDLQTTLDMELRLRDMQTATNQALRTLDSLKGQIEFVERTVRDRLGASDVPKELTDRIEAQKKRVDELSNKLAQPEGGLGFEGRSQLVERIGGLFFTLDSTDAAPTPAERDLYTDLQKEFDAKIAEVNRFLAEAVPQLNEALRRTGAPTLMTGKPIELPKP